MTSSVPRPEHPPPQFQRPGWANLNGQWTYEFDFDQSGKDRTIEYTGQPYIVDEFGGIEWVEMDETEHSDQQSWGYGEPPRSKEEFYSRLEEQIDVLLNLDHVKGYCYTQLTDVEQEQNGIHNYDRTTKFNMERIRDVFSKVS